VASAEVLEIIVSIGGYIVALRNPTHQYKNHIVVPRRDGIAVDILSREILDDLVDANFIEQGDCDHETGIIFKLTDSAREAAKTPLERYLKSKLVSLGYIWPENLEAKSLAWLEAEIRAIAPAA
jgi:hypothetical protein